MAKKSTIKKQVEPPTTIDEKKPGRPFKEVDEEALDKMAQMHLPDKVIADVLGISEDTLHRRYADRIALLQSEGKSIIASALFDEGVNKREPWALKALAQKHLDYSDKIKTETDLKHSFDNLTDEELDASIADKIKKLKGGV